MTTPVSRRAILRGLAVGATSPVWLRFADPAAFAAASKGAPVHSADSTPRLFVIFLRGGSDALRVVAPIGNAALDKLRPNVGLKTSDVFDLGNGYGLNKHLPQMYDWWKAGQLAVVQQVGTTAADMSHSASAVKWETGSPTGAYSTGWLGRYLDLTTGNGSVRAAAFSDSMPLSLASSRSDPLSLDTLKSFAFEDAKSPDAAARYAALKQLSAIAVPAGSLQSALANSQRELMAASAPLAKLATTTIAGKTPTSAQSVAELFAAGLGTEIGFLDLPGFDTHSNEVSRHNAAIAALDTAVNDFFTTAASLGVAQRSVVLVVSEFGRRVQENQSGGTDHGDATTVFAIGPGVRGGMYGPTLDVSALYQGNIATRIDLRSVYASVLGGWLNTDPAKVLGSSFPTIPLFS